MDQKHSSSFEKAKEEILSCWGRLKLIISRSRKPKNVPFSKSKNRAQQSGGFRYSPLSYAQNFDNGNERENDDQESLFRRFSSRYAAPFVIADE
ncbi:hypothetical protein ACS0TY_025556 [Phlomoides rotata]